MERLSRGFSLTAAECLVEKVGKRDRKSNSRKGALQKSRFNQASRRLSALAIIHTVL